MSEKGNYEGDYSVLKYHKRAVTAVIERLREDEDVWQDVLDEVEKWNAAPPLEERRE